MFEPSLRHFCPCTNVERSQPIGSMTLSMPGMNLAMTNGDLWPHTLV